MPTIVELPLAQHILPSGLPTSVYKRFNQIRKAQAIAFYLHLTHHGALSATEIDNLTQRHMASAARLAGVDEPHSDESRGLVRKLLRAFNGIEAPASEIPAPVTRDELAHAIQGLSNGLTTVLQAAAQGADR